MTILSYDDMFVYHGSRGGLDGPIKPTSRIRCDFGNGFYMTTEKSEAMMLVANDSMPVCYDLRIRLSEIPENRILRLEGMDGINAIIERRLASLLSVDEEAKYLQKWDRYDVIIAPVTEMRYSEIIRSFLNHDISETLLKQYILNTDIRMQIIAKTDFACSKIDILSEYDIYEDEAIDLIDQRQRYRKESLQMIEYIRNM